MARRDGPWEPVSMMTVLVHPGRLLKLTMPAAAAEEDHPNSENETHHTKGWKNSYSTGFSLQLVMHAKGMYHEDEKEASKENSQSDIWNALGIILLKLRQITRLLYSGTWKNKGWFVCFNRCNSPRCEYFCLEKKQTISNWLYIWEFLIYSKRSYYVTSSFFLWTGAQSHFGV